MLEISLLTPFSLQRDGQPTTLASRRTEALFVYLLRTGQPQAREVLANFFWDDLPQTQAAGNLRVLIANLHKTLGPYITVTRQSIAFDPKSAFHCDLSDLQQELARVRAEQVATGELSKTSADRLALALACYQGELLPGFYLRGGQGFDEWLATEREWLWTRAIAALSDLTSTYLRLGEFRVGIEQAQRLVKFDPLREESHQQLMRLLATDGQTQVALAHYQRCVQILNKELGVAPTLVTKQLFEQIQRGDWQKATPSLAIQPNPPVIPPTIPHTIPQNLPREMTPFVGREPELARLQHYLLDPAYPLLTLVAEGGAGKSRLALAAARQLLTHGPSTFVDGIWFVSLTTLQAGDSGIRAAISTAIGNAMGLLFQGQRPVEQQLLTLLQNRHCLLLLDNFEQLIATDAPITDAPITDAPITDASMSGETSAIDFVVELLERLPHLQLLVTSRIPLDLNSEFVIRLTGLPVPTDELPAYAATFASVRLFAERARRIAEDFDLVQSLSEVAAICRAVTGLPLAIELSAAWSGSLRPIEILLALQTNLDFLTTARRDIPLRQRSMRAVFDTSWQLLSAPSQYVIVQAACFNGGFTLDAAKLVVTVDSDTAQSGYALAKLLDSLVRQSLLQQDERGRYNVHSLLRDYATEKLTDLDQAHGDTQARGDTHGIAHRHSHYYLVLVEQAVDQAIGKTWYTRAELAPIYAELDNVRMAWQWASRHADLAGLRLGWLGLWHFYNSSALFQEGEETFRTTLELLHAQASASSESLRLIAQLQVAHASFLNALGRYGEAVTTAQRASTFAEAIHDEALKALGYAAWGSGLYRQGQYPEALAYLQQGLAATQVADLPLMEADLHKRLANTHQANHDFAAARTHYAQALNLYRQQHHRPGEGEVLNDLGWCSQQQHDLQQALTYLHQAEQIHQSIDNPHGQSMALINLALVYEMLGDYRQAFAYRQQVLELLNQFDDPYQRVLINHGLGVLFSRLGDYAAAEPYYLHALELDRAMGDRGGVAWTQNNLGLLYNQRGDFAAARTLHQEALQTSIELGALTTQGLAWSRLGQDYYGLGEFEESYDAYWEALALQQKLGQQVWLIESKSGLAATQLALNMQDEALALVEEILDFLVTHSLDSAREPLLVYWNCYQVLVACQDQRAQALLETAYHLLQERAAKTPNKATHHTFLQHVPVHRAIIAAFEKSR